MIKKSISKEKSKDIAECNKRTKKEVGKPVGISKAIQDIDLPKIWSYQKVEKNLISYLISIGRHVSLHLAGTNRIKKNKLQDEKIKQKQQKYQVIQNTRLLYDYLERIAKSLFGWQCTKLNIVYFFRNNNLFKLGYQKQTLINEKWNSIIRNIKFLLNEAFYYELIEILIYFENNYTSEYIADNLIQKSKQLDQVPQLVQNMFILLNKEQIIEPLGQIETCVQLENLKIIYINSLKSHKTYLQKMIDNIREIMNQEVSNNNQYVNDEDQEMLKINNDRDLDMDLQEF
ncbi:unnamed protein product [Paramecium sonneborni]|uniref:Uncharacterized protein n=1 Tax=Paramecium sonneborni TaxID=65129 RepID=A0A8S1N3H0_9CILI|nr:unnamed protein product [Paramecium sonneborni]